MGCGSEKKGCGSEKKGRGSEKKGRGSEKKGCGGQKKRACQSFGSHGQRRHSDEEERDAEGERICFLSVERTRGV